MDDLDIFLAEQMKNEHFKKSYMSAKRNHMARSRRIGIISRKLKSSPTRLINPKFRMIVKKKY